MLRPYNLGRNAMCACMNLFDNKHANIKYRTTKTELQTSILWAFAHELLNVFNLHYLDRNIRVR